MTNDAQDDAQKVSRVGTTLGLMIGGFILIAAVAALLVVVL